MPNSEWTRYCPTCNKELIYSLKYNYIRSMKANNSCLSCSKKGTRHHFYGKDSPRKGKIYSEEILTAISNKTIWSNNDNQWYRKCPTCQKPVKASSANHAFYRNKCTCYSCSSKRRTYSAECREKMKLSAINRVKRQGGMPSFNENACPVIDQYGIKNGYKFHHALNGGEKWIDGFALDGYDSTNLIAFEYDEPYHEKRKQKLLDLNRTQKLLENEKVKEIIRYSQKYNKLYKSFPTYSIPLQG